MQFWNSVEGYVKCRLVSASLEIAINQITQRCEIVNLEIVDDLTATFWVRRSDLLLIEKVNEHVEVIKHAGIYWLFLRLLKRPVIITGMLLLAFLVIYLPTRVLFITVYGNETVSDVMILDAAEKCGVQFSASREHVRSEKVKNMLLQAIPKLQWACINTKGCVAEIFVQERSDKAYAGTSGETDIVAGRDGIITDLTVYSGTLRCKVGEVVRKGQLLVSGYTDLGLLIKSEAANAEIMAETTRFVTAVALPQSVQMKDCVGEEARYSLLIGKKLINFYKDSGISPSGCGRINTIYRLTLPGGYYLPLSVVKEQTYYYDTDYQIDDETDSFDWLKDAADSYIGEQMVAGKIIQETAAIKIDGDICRFNAYYRCNEMIAISKQKEMYTGGKRS